MKNDRKINKIPLTMYDTFTLTYSEFSIDIIKTFLRYFYVFNV